MPPVFFTLRFTLLALTAVISTAPAISEAIPRLSLPIQCEPGNTCFIQSYVDVDASSGARDFTCGTATYDGHKGTDFRVLSAAAALKRFAVLSSADGTVKGVRDGMPDQFITAQTMSTIAGRECGNGVVVDHGGGWETQYCHMMRGSVAVKTGDVVTRGQKLGDVGFSGLAEFAHVHLEVRKDGKPVDPFTGRPQSEVCVPGQAQASGLWDEAAAKAFPYLNGEILGAGFVGETHVTESLEINHEAAPPEPRSPALVYFARVANLREGDQLKFEVSGPAGFQIESTTAPLDKNKAMYRGFAGKKLTAVRWPAGTYRGTVTILRSGRAISSRSSEFAMGD